MSENFKELFEQSIAGAQFYPGAIINAKVINIDDDFVTLNAGLKSEGIVPIEEFYDKEGVLEVGLWGRKKSRSWVLKCARFFSAIDGNGASSFLWCAVLPHIRPLYTTKMIAKSVAMSMQQKELHIRFK